MSAFYFSIDRHESEEARRRIVSMWRWVNYETATLWYSD